MALKICQKIIKRCTERSLSQETGKGKNRETWATGWMERMACLESGFYTVWLRQSFKIITCHTVRHDPYKILAEFCNRLCDNFLHVRLYREKPLTMNVQIKKMMFCSHQKHSPLWSWGNKDSFILSISMFCLCFAFTVYIAIGWDLLSFYSWLCNTAL